LLLPLPSELPVNRPTRRRPYQITIIGMMGWMAAASLGAAPLYYLVRAMQEEGGRHDNTSHAVGVIYMTAGPVLAVLVVAGMLALGQWIAKRRK
jgi:hypothetical protein